jgi:hypothetical protein
MDDAIHIKNELVEKYDLSLCTGMNEYPKTYKDFGMLYDKISDKWDNQIACVLFGHKKVAMTDYDSFDNPEDLSEYYEDVPKDERLRDYALKEGVQVSYDKYGTMFWYYPENGKNAEILIRHYNDIQRFPSIYYHEIQGLLLGYSETSIILYEIATILSDMKHQYKYNNAKMEQLYQKEINGQIVVKMKKHIQSSKKWISKQYQIIENE